MKRDLYFSKPVMNASGALGFTPDPKNGIALESFGAFVTNPLSPRPRLPASCPGLLQFPGGFLMHTGLPNPGLFSAIPKYETRWQKSELPIIVHLMAETPEETRRMVQALERVENVMAAELGFAPHPPDDFILATLAACRGEIPLIFSLPAEKILTLGPQLIEQGAQALSFSPPRGALPQNERSVTGRLYGPALFPQTLEKTYAAAKLGIPILAGNGIFHASQIHAALSAGALAVQVDASLWLPNPSPTQ
ncbi:MAG: hypothetical protein IT310_00505 [Anaerolineales bacterium]|nr:hypothetical protein [Anaerolineales bacterium]